ncbi:hypothetical protein PIB30_014237 [Stylosanthes scabra]|uniref:Uncharacterized protein n=1 Tax=Stylosanthes scabra TaxID=79078 RepID=A0ABU6X4M9_9FABA|nr:hypothetical protein [Stylosanthes scabra]
MDDGQETSVIPDNENLDLDLDGDQVGPETGNSGRRVFAGLGDDQSKQTQEMRHWMRSVKERLAQKSSRKRGRSRSRSRTRDSIQELQFQGTSPAKKVTIQGKEKPYPRRRRSPSPQRRRSPSLRWRRSPTPRRRRSPSPDYRDDG